MQVEFTQKQVETLELVASARGVTAARLVKDAALRLIRLDYGFLTESPKAVVSDPGGRLCPECGHRFAGPEWDGLDVHWRSMHEAVMSYQSAWPLIRAGLYESPFLDELEVLLVAEKRLAIIRAGKGATPSLDHAAREVPLVNSV
jgi:hypothetical protein